MNSRWFRIFVEELGETTRRTPVPYAYLLKFQGVLPAAFLDVWKEEGWCGYADGLFWTVNPDEYTEVLKQWLQGSPFDSIDEYYVLARSAFGTLYAWGRRNHRVLTVVGSKSALIGAEKVLRTQSEAPEKAAEVFFSSIRRKNLDLVDHEGNGLFQRALAKLGPLAPNEMYGFEPALIAGGSKRLENLRKVDLFIYLTVLRDLATPVCPFANVDPGPL